MENPLKGKYYSTHGHKLQRYASNGLKFYLKCDNNLKYVKYKVFKSDYHNYLRCHNINRFQHFLCYPFILFLVYIPQATHKTT